MNSEQEEDIWYLGKTSERTMVLVYRFNFRYDKDI